MPYKDPIKRKECARLAASKYRKNNPEKVKLSNKKAKQKFKENHREQYLQYKREWYYKNRESELKRIKKKRSELRKHVIAVYGNKCVCCDESIYEFLTVDHVHGGGSKHRRKIGAANILREIIKEGYPDKYQILCYNCNCAKAFSKVCPHNKQKHEKS